METYRIEIKELNKFIPIKGKLIRTPLSHDVKTKRELDELKTVIEFIGFTNYSIRPLSEILAEQKITQPVKKSLPIKKESRKNKTTLDKLIESKK